MSTPGYDPYRTLWHLFHQEPEFAVPIIESQRKQIENIVGIVTEHQMHPEGSTLVSRFKKMMEERNGRRLATINEPLAQGLLECLDAYQPYEPYTHPDRIRLGIFDHFKGGVYKVKGFSLWESGFREKVVEYDSMIFGTSHTRFAWQFCEVVRWPDGKYRSRWVYRGPDLKTPAPSFKVPSPEAHP